MSSDTSDIARAVAVGLDPAQGVLLAALRHRWWSGNRLDPKLGADLGVSSACWPDLERLLAQPAAAAFDEVFVAALRRRESRSRR